MTHIQQALETYYYSTRKVKFLRHAKSVSVWHENLCKIFFATSKLRKKVHNMDKNRPCNNLDTSRTEN